MTSVPQGPSLAHEIGSVIDILRTAGQAKEEVEKLVSIQIRVALLEKKFDLYDSMLEMTASQRF
jgi:hypothetical protein